VPTWMWLATIGALVGVIALDLILVDSRPHVFGPREATRWVIFYIALALAVAAFVFWYFGAAYAGQFLAGYITEYSLSVDNLFVFMVILSAFAVPAEHRHRVLLVGIVIALILRGILILIGAEAIARFAGTFFIFGALLLFTAVKVWRSHGEEPDPEGNALIRWLEKRVPTTRDYHGAKLFVRLDGRRHITPMLLVMLAIGTTDLLFAIDSIPAVFGLTQEAYLVFTANAFALMGLRQLFFLLDGLFSKIVYLNRGLAIILGFIGVKLVLEALAKTTDLAVPHVSIAVSLGVIIGVLVATTVVSLVAVRRNPALLAASPESEAEIIAAADRGVALEDLTPETPEHPEADDRGSG
ncbi:MAG: TerC/Alx family metal homeostasis membrane protein, partial [Candidatus Nanopelagicales bacterium]